MTAVNREQWLNQAIDALRPWFAAQDLEICDVHASVGWPSRGGTGTKARVIGQCWAASQSADGWAHIFISPVLEDVVDVLATLVHELIHAIVGTKAGHGGGFGRPARALGLEGKLTATHAGEALRIELVRIATELGPYPHSALSPTGDAGDEPKKQGTRMLKVVAECCGYTVRTTRKWLDEGNPSCPCGNEMHEEERDE